uniref:Uncharacterized protein n=1 Tax=Trichuris muris TaxID=70415 RepID=A0A5S6Q4S3_TRIMR
MEEVEILLISSIGNRESLYCRLLKLACMRIPEVKGVEEVGVADHASNANISPNGFYLVALLSVQLRVLNDSEKDRLSAPEKLFWSFSAGVLSQRGSWVAKYHEHDSLLKNIVKETLTDEERKAAGVEYEKANRVTTSGRIDVTRSRKSPLSDYFEAIPLLRGEIRNNTKTTISLHLASSPSPGKGAISPR